MAHFIQSSPNNNPCQLHAIDYFAKAFKNMDLELIEPILNECGIFKSEKKDVFIADLRRLFAGLKQMQMTIHPYFGLAKEFYPGAPVVEFHIEIHSGNIIDKMYFEDFFGKNRGVNFLIMRFGILSSQEKGIHHIFEPGECFNMSDILKGVLKN